MLILISSCLDIFGHFPKENWKGISKMSLLFIQAVKGDEKLQITKWLQFCWTPCTFEYLNNLCEPSCPFSKLVIYAKMCHQINKVSRIVQNVSKFRDNIWNWPFAIFRWIYDSILCCDKAGISSVRPSLTYLLLQYQIYVVLMFDKTNQHKCQ